MSVTLYGYQRSAVERLQSGCILCGDTGSGKSITALAYYFEKECGGMLDGTLHGLDIDYIPMREPKDLYIITTAQKRDKKEWDIELAPFLLRPGEKQDLYSIRVVVDSWNNIAKYKDIRDAFFLFDEQRVVGKGKWVQSFLNIARFNHWLLLSATPGDTWMDYIPVFIANGFYRNRTDFKRQHVVEVAYSPYFKVDHYINEGKLLRIRRMILVDMDYRREVTRHTETFRTEYDKEKYKRVLVDRWDIYEDLPIVNAGKCCYLLRRVVNSDPSRIQKLDELLQEHPRIIVFYNYDYELDILRSYPYSREVEIAEWNGHLHQPIPASDCWLYFVQFAAGAEGWNCILTDTLVFYSESYSYKAMHQAAGRIDRLNSPFKDLYYYHFTTTSTIDRAIARSLSMKKNFNEKSFLGDKYA